jgi:hypothetical protein
MRFEPYENVPLYISTPEGIGEFIFAEEASIAVSQPLSVTRQVDDNLFQIVSYVENNTAEDSLIYEEKTFVSEERFLALIGPSGGPPQPLATSIRKIPKDTEIIFQSGQSLFFDEDVYPDGNQYIVSLYAKSGDWSLTRGQAQSGHFNPLFNYVSDGPIVGTLDVSFYPSTGNLPYFFNITGLLNPAQFPPVNEERLDGHIGPFEFTHAYLNSFEFSISPNSLIQANASFQIYGTLKEDQAFLDDYFNGNLYKQQSIPHGSNSKIIGATPLGIEHPISFSYSIQVDRTSRFEAPTSNNYNNKELGITPTRVTKKAVTINMSIQGESLDPDMLQDGFNGRIANLKAQLYDLSYENFGSDEIFNQENHNGFLTEFSCHGPITSQALSVTSQGNLIGAIETTQTLK